MPDSSLPRNKVIADLVNTQMMAARVYLAFARITHGDEYNVWKTMLQHEIDHTDFLSGLFDGDSDDPVILPPVRYDLFRELAQRALLEKDLSAIQRVELALRIEHAEIDYGLEGLLLGRHGKSPLPPYKEGVEHHYEALFSYASRYAAAPEIAIQIERIREHYPEIRFRRTPSGRFLP